jgi:flavodoxin
MKLKMIVTVLLIICVGAVFLLKSNNNGGNVMAAESTTKANSKKKILVAYFSRTGEQYSVGNIKEGNTAIIGKMIATKTGGDTFEIKVANDKYPKGYTALTEYAQREKRANERPAIIGKVDNFADYDTIFIGYPNWWADMPMPVYTFLESYDFTGKTVIPFCTHEGSGLSGTERNVETVTKANVKKGLAIYGHVAQNSRTEADKKVSDWLKGLGF